MHKEFQDTHFYFVSLFLESCPEESAKLNAIIPQFSLCLKRPGLFLFCTLLYQQSHAEGNGGHSRSMCCMNGQNNKSTKELHFFSNFNNHMSAGVTD